jgi:hypothetical protein
MQPDQFNQPERKLNPAIISLIVVVIIGAIVGTAYIATRENSDQVDSLADGKVTTVSTTGSATGGNSAQYQSMFLSSYEDLVEGKSIDSISLSRVSGSSLTSNGFNAAIEEIKRDALS